MVSVTINQWWAVLAKTYKQDSNSYWQKRHGFFFFYFIYLLFELILTRIDKIGMVPLFYIYFIFYSYWQKMTWSPLFIVCLNNTFIDSYWQLNTLCQYFVIYSYILFSLRHMFHYCINSELGVRVMDWESKETSITAK